MYSRQVHFTYSNFEGDMLMEIISLLSFFVFSFVVYKRENDIESCLSSHKIKQMMPFVVCFIISFIFAVRLGLSPFNSSLPGTDSSVFLYIGREMYNGAVPYRDLFDHKGVILYFIEYLGYLIGFGNKIGVWIIEVINIFITSLIFYHIAAFFTKSKVVCYMSIFIVLQISSLPFIIEEGGNLTEEYALPWIALSLYFVIRFFAKKDYRNWHIIAIGVSFTIVFFLRVNMVGLWAALLLVVVIYFIKNKRNIEILKCALLFISGCIIVLIPICIYLLQTNSLNDMINYYFVFNLQYTADQAGIKPSISLFLSFISIAGVITDFFIVYSLITNFKNKFLKINIITLFFAFLSIAISGRNYSHYGIILIPFFLIPTVLSLSPFMEKTNDISTDIKKKSVFISVAAISFLGIFLQPVYNFYYSLKTPAFAGSALSEYLSENTKKTDDILIIGNAASYYINSDCHTNNKYFYQEPPIDLDDNLFEEFMLEVKTKPSEYIIDCMDKNLLHSINPKNYRSFISYLDEECQKGNYHLEKNDDFTIYIKN